VKASTHTDIYRPFTGSLREHPRRWLTIGASSFRQGLKRKIPALLLFTPVAIGCVIACFRVYFRFQLLSGDLVDINSPGAAGITMMVTETLGDVVTNIFTYTQGMSFFLLMIVAWYGAGLIADDRRLGAHLLYFSRPISRLDYLFGKGAGAFAFGFLALTLPCLLVCFVATLTSPDWSFIVEEWRSILKVILFSGIWVSTVTVLVLTISSLVGRKSHALIGIIGTIVLSSGVSAVLAGLFKENAFSLLDLFENFERLGEWMFDRWDSDREVTIGQTLAALGGLWGACLLILWVRIRRLEVVA
jgi:ABC-type transport system involved in multi-copper enzyme maturation permease subunit